MHVNTIHENKHLNETERDAVGERAVIATCEGTLIYAFALDDLNRLLSLKFWGDVKVHHTKTNSAAGTTVTTKRRDGHCVRVQLARKVTPRTRPDARRDKPY